MFKELNAKLLEYFSGKYTIIKSFDAEEMDLDGVIAVNMNEFEIVNNNISDWKCYVNINAQTFVDTDPDKTRIFEMFYFVFSKLDDDAIKNLDDNIVGVVKDTGSLTSDGETNNFSVKLELFLSGVELTDNQN